MITLPVPPARPLACSTVGVPIFVDPMFLHRDQRVSLGLGEVDIGHPLFLSFMSLLQACSPQSAGDKLG